MSRATWLAIAVIIVALSAVVLATTSTLPSASATGAPQPISLAATGANMTFHSTTVPAVGVFEDLYEPSVAVSPAGTVYVAGHSLGAFTTRAPAWYSHDDGANWTMLPGLAPVSTGNGLADSILAGGQTEGDEGIIVTDANGHAWMLDNGGANDVLYTWCNEGATLCATDHKAYSGVDDTFVGGAKCPEIPLMDRPWLAYGHGHLLLNNNGGGVMQLVTYDPNAGRLSVNDCAGRGGIPGVPSVRESDGLFIVPQTQNGNMAIVHGYDARTITTTKAFVSKAGFACSANFGFTGFSSAGTAFAAGAGGTNQIVTVAASSDAVTWRNVSFATADPLAFMWINGNPVGEGAFFTWSTTHDGCRTVDVFAAHVRLDVNGVPFLQDASKVIAGLAGQCGDYAGSAVGPDGRGYLAAVDNSCGRTRTPLGSPLHVWVQDGGPTT